MGSKSSYSTYEVNDASQVQGLAAVRGDGNTVSVLDGDAIKQAFASADRNSEGLFATIADITRASSEAWTKYMDAAAGQNDKVLGYLNNASATSAEQTRQSLAAVAGAVDSANMQMKPQNVLLIVAVLVVVVVIARS